MRRPRVRSAAALLGYAEHTQGRALSHLQRLTVERDGELIELPPTTRRNLELVQTLRGEDSPTLFLLLDSCMTGMGSRMLKCWLLEPRRDRSQAQQRLDAITTLREQLWQRLREQVKGTSERGARSCLRRVGTAHLLVGEDVGRAHPTGLTAPAAMQCWSTARPRP